MATTTICMWKSVGSYMQVWGPHEGWVHVPGAGFRSIEMPYPGLTNMSSTLADLANA